jgi:hypothetical protein
VPLRHRLEQHWLLSSQAVPEVLQTHVAGLVLELHPPEQHVDAAFGSQSEPGPLQHLNVPAVAPNALPQTLGEQQAFTPVPVCEQVLPVVTQVGLAGAGGTGGLVAMHKLLAHCPAVPPGGVHGLPFVFGFFLPF